MDASAGIKKGAPPVPYLGFKEVLVGVAATVVLVAGILALANVEGFNQLGKAGGITCVCLSGAVFSIPLLMKVYQCLRALRADPADKLLPILEEMIRGTTKDWTALEIKLGDDKSSKIVEKGDHLNQVRQYCATKLGARFYEIILTGEGHLRVVSVRYGKL